MDTDQLAARVSTLEESLKKREALAKFLVHDLNGPLSSITGTLEYLRAISPSTDLETNSEIVDCLRDVDVAAQFLRRLIADIAAVEQVADIPALHRSTVNVATLARDIARARVAHDSVKKLSVDFFGDESACSVTTDRDLVERVIWILADNACRNAPVGSTVSAKASSDAGSVTIAFTDAGPMLPLDHVAHVFDIDYRAWAKARGGRPGRGLSLPFVKLAADRLGGSVAVDSPTPTTTRFSFTLPRTG
ncbi:MAG: HAMP domain-containing histidine kinase [Deltaproteobacteria bacterium]|nr:HAMP domain-containing histidine kinase [Deltaproteobacteria bacterium]